jgi:predicted nucleic acid-binding Zn ribbon protein
VAHRLGVGDAATVGPLFARWPELVGDAVAAHVRPLRIDGDTLVVSVDHPAWAAQLHHLGPDILARIADEYGPAATPSRLQVKVRR